MLDNWHRIEKVVKWTGLSVNAFAREIGLNRSENLYQIKRGNNGISRELAEIITAKYPSVSKAWLLTGEGEMFIGQTLPRESAIPFYKTDVVRLASGLERGESSCDIYLPMFSECDFAALSLGLAMIPAIPPGAIVICKTADKEFILPGDDYLVVSDRFTGIRSLRTDPDSEMVRLVPRNKDEYDEILLPLNEIKHLYSIQGVIINKTT